MEGENAAMEDDEDSSDEDGYTIDEL